MAHDYVYGSQIKQGVIMVCTPDLYYQEFKIEGPELRRWKHAFLKRLDMYHDLMFDEKEKTTPMKAEDFNDGSNEMGDRPSSSTKNKAVKYQKDLVSSAMAHVVKMEESGITDLMIAD